MRDPRWRELVSKKINALEFNKTWNITDLPLDKKTIGSKWIFTIKYNSDGTVERYKAWLVSLGTK